MENLEITYKFKLENNLFYKTPEETDTQSLIKQIEKKDLNIDKEKSKLNLLIEGYNNNSLTGVELNKYLQNPQGKIKGYYLKMTSNQLEGELELTINTYRKLEPTRTKTNPSKIGTSMSDFKRTSGITGEIRFKGKNIQENAVKVIKEIYETIESYFSNTKEAQKQLGKTKKGLFDKLN